MQEIQKINRSISSRRKAQHFFVDGDGDEGRGGIEAGEANLILSELCSGVTRSGPEREHLSGHTSSPCLAHCPFGRFPPFFLLFLFTIHLAGRRSRRIFLFSADFASKEREREGKKRNGGGSRREKKKEEI